MPAIQPSPSHVLSDVYSGPTSIALSRPSGARHTLRISKTGETQRDGGFEGPSQRMSSFRGVSVY